MGDNRPALPGGDSLEGGTEMSRRSWNADTTGIVAGVVARVFGVFVEEIVSFPICSRERAGWSVV